MTVLNAVGPVQGADDNNENEVVLTRMAVGTGAHFARCGTYM
jgi:hypothetical protein